jgi:DNA-binding NarL/FixJ family response regulator
MQGSPAVSEPILVVDDDRACADAFCNALVRAGYETVSAATGEEALELAGRRTPSLAVLDICLPGISGYEVCHELRQSFGDGLPIMFISAARGESYDRVAGLLLGADDYLAKPVAPDELLARVRRLLRRRAPIAAGVATRLTKREQEVLGLLAEGCDIAEIASRLHLSPKTVATHIEHILGKLGVRSRAQAVAFAYRGKVASSRS